MRSNHKAPNITLNFFLFTLLFHGGTHCSFFLFFFSREVNPWRKNNESWITKHTNNFFFILLLFHATHFSFLLLRRGWCLNPLTKHISHFILLHGSLVCFRMSDYWSLGYVFGNLSFSLCIWFSLSLVCIWCAFLCVFGLGCCVLFRTNYSVLFKGAFLLFRQGFSLLIGAINLFRIWHMCGYEINFVADHLSYFVLICAFLMFVVRYMFVFVNSSLIVENFVFLVHMKFPLLIDTFVLFVSCIMFGVGI